MIAIDREIWSPIAMPVVLAACGLVLTLATGFIQIRGFPRALRSLRERGGTGSGSISPFQALTTALAATVGNGNIGGVATAILIGGPGAVFWMWITAVIGMATKYAEATLGVRFRVDRGGTLASGPMYYLRDGLGSGLGRSLASWYAVLGLCTAMFGTGNMGQSNTVVRTIVEAGRTSFGVEVQAWVPGLCVAALVGLVLLGGIRRIAAVCEALVPAMIAIYVGLALVFLVLNLERIPAVVGTILSSALSPTAALGGFVGASVADAVAAGVSRGVLSNEAGLGSAAIAHGIARVDHPVRQGLVGVLEVFVDTIVVCSMTAFVILSSGLWTDERFAGASADLTAAALHTSIPGAPLLVAICSFLFGFSTLIGWCFYGERCFEYVFGQRFLGWYRAIFTGFSLLGAVVSVPLVWALGTLLNGLMALPNLIGLVLLTPTVVALTREFFSGRARGSRPHPAR